MRTMHLFAGAGGGLLADLILGHKPVVAVEWEPYACQVLRDRAADGWFPDLQVWEGDVRMFDPSEYAGSVDCIHAGFPCQDISSAGKQAGVGPETRSGLYREVLRIAGVVRPRYLFLENVSAIVTNGLGTVLADLAALGYDSEWLCLRASDCGANHHRDRWWLLAYTKGSGDRRNTRKLQSENERQTQERQKERVCESNYASQIYVSNSNLQHGEWRSESQQSSSNSGQAWAEFSGCSEDVADTSRELPHGSRETRNWRGEPANSRCQFCGYQFDVEQLGIYGCPNCEGEGLADTDSQRCEEFNTAGITTQPERDGWRIDGGRCAGWWKTEPDVCGMADELAAELDKGEINACADDIAKQGLPDMRQGVQQACYAEREASGREAFHSADALQQDMRKHTGATDEARLFVESAEAPEKSVRGMRLHEVVACSPCGSGQGEQHAGEHPNAVQTLPRLLAHNSKTHVLADCRPDATVGWWQTEPDVGRVVNDIANRSHRLKALGNGQVPLQAAVAWKLLGGE